MAKKVTKPTKPARKAAPSNKKVKGKRIPHGAGAGAASGKGGPKLTKAAKRKVAVAAGASALRDVAFAGKPTHGRASSDDPVLVPTLPAPEVLVPPQDSDIVLINHGNLSFIKVCPTKRQAEYWEALLGKGMNTRIQGLRKAELCHYSLLELSWLFTNSGGHFYRWDGYQQGLDATHHLLRSLPVDNTPETVLAERLGHTLPPTQPHQPFIGSGAGHQFHLEARGVDVIETPPHGVAEVPTTRSLPPPPPPADDLRPTMPPPSAPQASPKGRRGRAAQAPPAGAAQAQPQTPAQGKPPREPRQPKPAAAPGVFVPSPKGQKLWDACDAQRKAKGKPPSKEEAIKLGVAVGFSESSAAVSFGRWCKQRGV